MNKSLCIISVIIWTGCQLPILSPCREIWIINEVTAAAPSMCKIMQIFSLKWIVGETHVSFLLLWNGYWYLINSTEKIWRSTSCCGRLARQTERQYWRFCRTLAHVITLGDMWMKLLVRLLLSRIKNGILIHIDLQQMRGKKVKVNTNKRCSVVLEMPVCMCVCHVFTTALRGGLRSFKCNFLSK